MSILTRRHGLALLAAITLGPLALSAHAESVTGSGRMANESRAITGFEAITLEASFTVKVRQGASEAVAIQADDNLLPYIETVVDTRRDRPTLVLRWKRSINVRHSSDIVVTVDARTVRALSASGSGTIDADAIQGDRLSLAVAGSGDVRVREATVADLQASVAGSGDVRANGSAAVLKVSIAGSGDVDLSGVEAEEVKVSIAGSGDAQVTAHQSLSVSIAGSGDVRYGGRVPSVKTSIVGSGDVRRR
jgi:hypothetical protein